MQTFRFLPLVAIVLATPFAGRTQTQLDLRYQAKSGYVITPFSPAPAFTATGNNVTTFLLTLTADVTNSTLSAASAGQLLTFRICQDGAGDHAFVWPPHVFSAGTVNAAANTCTNQTFIFDGAGAQPLGVAVVTGLSGGIISMPGSTSGATTLQPSSAAGGTLTLPARTATVATTLGLTSANHCAQFDSSGNLVDSGGTCSGGGGGKPVVLTSMSNGLSGPQVAGRAAAFVGIEGPLSVQGNEADVAVNIHVSGTAQNLCVRSYRSGAQPGDGDLVFTLRKNAADTILVATIPASGGFAEYCSSGTVSVLTGDALSIKVANASASASTYWTTSYLEIQ